MKVIFLGTGTSGGVPEIGCDCAVCRSSDPRDKRLRPSILIISRGTTILVDVTPDFRQQALTYEIKNLDAVLFTHFHADHVFGINDLRRYNLMQGTAVPAYGNEHTMVTIRKTFPFIWNSPRKLKKFLPRIELNIETGPFPLNGLPITPIPVLHGGMPVWGYRLGSFAYVTDCNVIPDESLEMLHDLDVLVLGALRRRPHIAHFSLEEAVEQAKRIDAKTTYFTHMSHDLQHEASSANLPSSVCLAYDGLTIELPE